MTSLSQNADTVSYPMTIFIQSEHRYWLVWYSYSAKVLYPYRILVSAEYLAQLYSEDSIFKFSDTAQMYHPARLFPHLPRLPFPPFKLPVFAVQCWFVSQYFPDVCLEPCPACSLGFLCVCLLRFRSSPLGWFDLCLFSVIIRIKPIFCIWVFTSHSYRDRRRLGLSV